VEERFGGPVWHASGRGRTPSISRALALEALSGVGDKRLGQWVDEQGMGRGIVHVVRRLTEEEREEFSVPEPYDIRGTDEEQRRIAAVLAEAPHLRRAFSWA
jgi:hypothetical protein